MRTHLSGGKQIPLIKNPNLDYGTYDWTLDEIASWSTATKFITKTGVFDVAFVATSELQGVFSRVFTVAELTPYKGRRLTFGALIYSVDMTVVRLQIHNSTLVVTKTSFTPNNPLIDYGNNWGLYTFTVDIPNDNASTWQLSLRVTPENTETSDIKVAGIFSWIGGIQEIPCAESNPDQTALVALADDATPSVLGLNYFLTGGTTTITDFDDGVEAQVITVIAEHSLTITDGTNIFLNGSADFDMDATDSLTLICKADNKWYEISRSDNT